MRSTTTRKVPGSIKRLLTSFAAVERKPEHCNWGDNGPWLRDFGFSVPAAAALIRWGEQYSLVCTFEDGNGYSPNRNEWQPAFLKAAVEKHLELYGELGRADIPQAMLDYVARLQ